jgi:soluble lytic murein transglycosylase-like protein
MKSPRLYPMLCLVAALLPSTALAGGIYRYVEKDGTIVYTNVPPTGRTAKKLGGNFHRAPRATEPAQERAAIAGPNELDDYIVSAARRYRIPVNLVRAVMHAESNFDRSAVSPAGASGLMQLMPNTAQEMFVKDIFDARENIEGGTRYLRVLANQYEGDMVRMIAAYNAGPDAVKKYGGKVPPFPETQAYVRKVLDLYFRYKDQEQAQAQSERTEDPNGT